jgi:hypothetical protein
MNHARVLPVFGALLVLGTLASAQEEVKITKKQPAMVFMESGAKYEGYLHYLDSKKAEFQAWPKDQAPIPYKAEKVLKVRLKDGTTYEYDKTAKRYKLAEAAAPAAKAPPADPPDAQPDGKGDVLTKTVTVQGEGIDADKAEVDAVFKAVYQVIGMYLDAKQELKNDQLTESILTFTNGNIYSAKPVNGPEKQADGSYRVTMEVSVAVTDLKALLKKYNHQAAVVPGEERANKSDVVAKLEQYQAQLNKKAAMNLGDLLNQYSAARMLTPMNVSKESLGQGQYEVSFQIGPEMLQWAIYRHRLESALRKTAGVQPMPLTVGPLPTSGAKAKGIDFMQHLNGNKNFDESSFQLKEVIKADQKARGQDYGHYLGVLTALKVGNDPKMHTSFAWTIYPVEKEVVDRLQKMKVKPVKIVVTLVDAKGNPVASERYGLEQTLHIKPGDRKLFHCDRSMELATLALVAPFPWTDHNWGFAVVRPDPITIKLNVNPVDVDRVHNVIVHIE